MTMVYLSGRMDGVSVEEGNEWRLIATKKLNQAGYKVYNPYSGKSSNKEEHKKHTANEVFHRDVFFLDKSDIVLVNLDMPESIMTKDAPFFTIGEMFLAQRDRKPIISFKNPFVGRHGYEAIITKTLENLDEAIDFIVLNY